MDAFFVDGAHKRFADVILENRKTGQSCFVASYGFGVKQVMTLIHTFRQVLLVADESHSQLNAKAFNTVTEMDRIIPYFTFKPMKTHAKLAIVDNETVIFTSANLSANQRIESYLVGSCKEVDGVEELKTVLGDPGSIFKKVKTDSEYEFEFDEGECVFDW